MVRLNETADRIVKMMIERGANSGVAVALSDDGLEVFAYSVGGGVRAKTPTDSGLSVGSGCSSSALPDTMTIGDIFGAFGGSTDILQDAANEDDQYTLEDAVKDVLNFLKISH